MIEVKTYTDFLQPEVYEKIEHILRVAQHDPNNRMPSNYTPSKIALDNTLAVSIAERNGIPFSYSSVMHRPIYKESVRVISRFYYLPLKTHGLKNSEMPLKYIWRDHTIQMIDSQVKLAYELGFKGVFISQHDKSLKVFTRMYYGLEVLSTVKGWHFDPKKKYKVCNGKDCEHWIFWHKNLFLEEIK
jgi:hypothetical protein